jgi:hypothetical protein
VIAPIRPVHKSPSLPAIEGWLLTVISTIALDVFKVILPMPTVHPGHA